MEKKIISLIAGLLLCLLSFGQLIGTGMDTWANNMLTSYMTINNHNVFSQVYQDSILARLKEPYVYYTFRDKKICDFFLFFPCNNKTTPLTTKTITKTGATLRWNYGNGNIYFQNNLPANITNGIVTVTSTDGFTGCTLFSLNANYFTGYLPNFQYYFPIAITLDFSSNDFIGKYPVINNMQEPCNIYTYGNLINDTMPDLSACMKILRWTDYRQIGTTSPLNYVIDKPKGYLSQFNSNGLVVVTSTSSRLVGIRMTNFAPTLTTLNLGGNWLTPASISKLFADMKTYYTTTAPTANLAVSLKEDLDNYNGWLEGGAANADLVALQGIYTAAGKTLTATFNEKPRNQADTSYFAFTWDDAAQSVYNNALPIFNEYGLTSTVYITINYINASIYGETGLTWGMITNLNNAGWTIGAHGVDHLTLSTSTAAQIRAELRGNDSAMLANGLPKPLHHAYPHGGFNNQTVDSCKNYYKTSRITREGFVTNDSMRLQMILIEKTGIDFGGMAYIKERIDTAYARGQSVIFLAHRCYPAYNGDVYDKYIILTNELRELINYIQAKPKARIVNVNNLYEKLW